MATTAKLSIISIWAIAAWALVVLSLLATNPQAIGPVGVTVWFVLLLAALAAVATLSLYSLRRWLKLEPTPAARLRVSRRQGGLIAAYLTLILAMRSLNQLALRDAVLLAAIFCCTELLMRFRAGISHE